MRTGQESERDQKQSNEILNETPKPDHRTPEEIELEKIERRLRAVQMSLEILTSICASLPDPESMGDDDDDGGDEKLK